MSRGQDSSDNDKGESNSNSTNGYALGSEKTARLPPMPREESSPKVNYRFRNVTNRTVGVTAFESNNRQSLFQSQHTEIEFYSSDDEADDEENGSFFDSDDNSSNDGSGGQIIDHARYNSLQRAASRQSFQSTASDAFSLPVGSQDDVSSLECDNAGNNEEKDGIDDISLEAQIPSNDTGKPPLAPVGVVDFFDSPKRDRKTFREALGNSKKNSTNALHMSFSSRSGLDLLPETVEEEDNDEDDGDDKSVQFCDLVTGMNLEGSSHKNEDVDTSWRLHRSLFLPRNVSSFFLPMDVSSPVGTPRSRSYKHLGARTKSLVVDDISYDVLASTLPPELDLMEARKYIIQLSQGVTTESPFKDTLEHRVAPPSAAKSSAIESEYTEVIIDDDDEDVPLNPRLLSTPQTNQSFRGRNNPRESLQSYDYTEIVEESGDEEVIEEVIIEEDYDDDATEIIYEEDDECDDTKPPALGVIPGMVNAT